MAEPLDAAAGRKRRRREGSDMFNAISAKGRWIDLFHMAGMQEQITLNGEV